MWPISPQGHDSHLLGRGVAVKGRSRLAGTRSAALEGDAHGIFMLGHPNDAADPNPAPP